MLPEPLARLPRITLVGTGLIGTSLGLGLRAVGYAGRIVGVARSADALERAAARGAVDEAATDLGAAVAASGPHLLVVATPLRAFEAVFRSLAAAPAELVITDVGSTKASVVALANRHLRSPARFVGAHPMAGSERSGPDGAHADLFKGRPCVLTPEAHTEPEAISLVSSLWQALGMRILERDAAAHDRAAASVSHLPHVAAAGLARVAGKHGGLELASSGFRDATRLASSNPSMWADILAHNREAVLEAIAGFERELAELRRGLEAGEDEAVAQWLAWAKSVRDDWRDPGETGG